jgi:adenosylmethionine-8-amino-7-oxononanoate aminotransferase
MYQFNVRVYGLLINELDEVLLSDEEEYGHRFIKFPGGGLEHGEGLIDGLKREFMEECNADVEIISHFYTTDFYVKSAFNDSQVISVYYIVKNIAPLNLPFKTKPYDFDGEGDVLQAFRWVKLSELTEDKVTFQTDKRVVEKLISPTQTLPWREGFFKQVSPLANGGDLEGAGLTQRDQKVIWHPYTQMQTALPPIPIVRGDGALLFDEQGKSYIDAISSWWVNIHGHANSYIAQKVAEQLLQLEHVIFAGFTHQPAIALAERLLAILPNNQQKVFYSDNGSTAVEVALKMCLQYWHNQGIKRTKILAFKNAYHGDTFGAMAVSGRSAFTAAFDSLLFEVEFIDLPTEQNLKQIKSRISYLRSELACFIFEPLVQGSAGMVMYEAGLLDQLMAHCRSEGILTIADEVFTGFGRTGKRFACDHISQQPDIMCFSKGLTGGTMAMGLTTCTLAIYNAFLSADKLKTLFHGHSYTANPVSCAAALASMDLFMAPETNANINRIVLAHQQFAAKIKHHPQIKTIRQTGTILAMEWQTGEGTSYFSSLRDKLYTYFLNAGIILRPLGNVIYILPPYCITDEQLLYIYAKIEEALAEVGK